MRLMLTLTPVVCVLSGIAFSKLFEVYLKVDTPYYYIKLSLIIFLLNTYFRKVHYYLLFIIAILFWFHVILLILH